MRGEPGREHRQRRDRPLRQPRLDGVAVHHLPVSQHVRAADVDGAVDVGRDPRGPSR